MFSHKSSTPEKIIISPSGIRGIFGSSLTLNYIIKFSHSYALWIGPNSNVLLGRDSRSSGKVISEVIIEILSSYGINILHAGISPTPALLYYKRKHNLDGAIIISASHNPPEYNGLKCVGKDHIFLGLKELNTLNEFMANYDKRDLIKAEKRGSIKKISVNSEYIKGLKLFLDMDVFKNRKLKVALDLNACSGVGVVDQLLREIGCEIEVINENFTIDAKFPHGIEPIERNLSEISDLMRNSENEIGFAYDCDSDRVTIIGNTGKIYSEDISVAIIIDYMLKKYKEDSDSSIKPIIIVNSASSMIFEEIATKFDATLIRTAIGERHLATRMKVEMDKHPKNLILGGEGSNGGFMFPIFNNCRDGIFATCIICEMILKSQKNIKSIIEEFPVFHKTTDRISIINLNIQLLMTQIEKELQSANIEYILMDRDIIIKKLDKKEWILFHPSNTEPILRLICEADDKQRSEELYKRFGKLARKTVNKLTEK